MPMSSDEETYNIADNGMQKHGSHVHLKAQKTPLTLSVYPNSIKLWLPHGKKCDEKKRKN